ncbi:MAG: hypothetical protein WC346_01635 [Methanogenium sp.]|jgi:hypothetical protein
MAERTLNQAFFLYVFPLHFMSPSLLPQGNAPGGGVYIPGVVCRTAITDTGTDTTTKGVSEDHQVFHLHI